MHICQNFSCFCFVLTHWLHPTRSQHHPHFLIPSIPKNFFNSLSVLKSTAPTLYFQPLFFSEPNSCYIPLTAPPLPFPPNQPLIPSLRASIFLPQTTPHFHPQYFIFSLPNRLLSSSRCPQVQPLIKKIWRITIFAWLVGQLLGRLQ